MLQRWRPCAGALFCVSLPTSPRIGSTTSPPVCQLQMALRICSWVHQMLRLRPQRSLPLRGTGIDRALLGLQLHS